MGDSSNSPRSRHLTLTVDGWPLFAWPLVLAVSLGTFLVPGLLGAGALAQRAVVPLTAVLLAAVALSSLLGYVAFWVYLADHRLGRALSLVACATSAAAPVLSARARRSLARSLAAPAVGVPLALLFLVAVLYNGLLSAHGSHTPLEARARSQLLSGSLPVDDALPEMFAGRLYEGDDPRALFADWRSSDRPPLQTGAVLLQRPVASALGIDELHYHLLGTALQCSWVAAVWALAAAGRFRPAGTALALAAATFSGFFFLNSAYVWPKLYAAALAILAYVLLVGRRPSWPSTAVAALGAGLGMLAHAGAVFTLLPLALLVVTRRTRPPLAAAVAGATVAAVLLGPWWAYARFYDPPGDRLAKWHLAGVIDIDDRSLGRALADSYGALDAPEMARNKAENLSFVARPLPRWSHLRAGGVEYVRVNEFYRLAWALGPLNLAWPALAWGLARRERTWRRHEWRSAALMVAVGAVAVVVWALLMFGPATTLVHQGSYATIVLLWVGLAGLVAAVSRRWAAGLAAAQLAYFAVVWARDLPGPDGAVHLPDVAFAALAAALVVALLWRVAASPVPPGAQPESPPAPHDDVRPGEEVPAGASA